MIISWLIEFLVLLAGWIAFPEYFAFTDFAAVIKTIVYGVLISFPVSLILGTPCAIVCIVLEKINEDLAAIVKFCYAFVSEMIILTLVSHFYTGFTLKGSFGILTVVSFISVCASWGLASQKDK